MKLTGIFTAASLLIAGIVAQTNDATTNDATTNSDFDLSSLNGTWRLAGLTKLLFIKTEIIAHLYNTTIGCSQIYITGNSSNSSYFQPSIEIGWYNQTAQKSEQLNVSLSGIITLNSSNASDAQFTAQMSLPIIAKNLDSKINMLDYALTAGNSSDPLPDGPDFSVDLDLKFASSKNDSINDIILASFSNITYASIDNNTSVNNDTSTSTGSNNTDSNNSTMGNTGMKKEHLFQILLTNSSVPIDKDSFNSITTSLNASSLIRLNNTCNATKH